MINIDNSDSKNKTSDSKNPLDLDAIMDEDDDSDSSSDEKDTPAKHPTNTGGQEKKETKALNDDEEISEGER